MKKKKTWNEKLRDSKGLPKISKVCGKMLRKWGEGSFVIPAPIEVDELIRKVPRGKLVTIDALRLALAKKHRVSFACPLTTGIFAWIAAHAAEEARAAGEKKISPYWRVLKTGGEINPKYPGGVDGQCKLLRGEGHAVVQKGKRFCVRDYEQVAFDARKLAL